MGFKRRKQHDGEPDSERKRGESHSKRKRQHELKHFEPTTKKELRMIRKRARKAERKGLRDKQERRDNAKANSLPHIHGKELRKALLKKQKFHVYKSNLFNTFLELCKTANKTPPAYKRWLKKRRLAENEFMFEINTVLSGLSWTQLTQLIHSATSSNGGPDGFATHSWSEAFRFSQHLISLALAVREKKGAFRLTDRSVLDDWPVAERKRPTKEDRMNLDELEERNAALLAMARSKDEDEDEEDEDEDEEDEDEEDEDEEDEDDEDEDEDDDDEDDEDDDDEDEKPTRGKKKGKRTSKDEDDEDDEDEKPTRGKRGAAKKKGGKRKAKDADDEDADEKPTRSKRGRKKGDKGGKATNKGDEAGSHKEGVFESNSLISRTGKRYKGDGPKAELFDLVPTRGGVKFSVLVKKAAKDGMSAKRVKALLPKLESAGCLEIFY